MAYRTLNPVTQNAVPSPLQNSAFDINIPDIITITARLAQILAEEVDLLQQMKVSRISSLQEEKQRLTRALEIQKKLILKHPQALDAVDPRDMADLKAITEIFNEILAHNHRQLRIARDVNIHLVEAIRDAVSETTRHPQYGERGQQDAFEKERLSVTLNKMA